MKNVFKKIQINHGHLGFHTNDWGICEEERNMTVAVGPVNTLIQPRRSLFSFSGGPWENLAASGSLKENT